MTANSLIDLTLEEIAREYQPCAFAWMKAGRPDDWKRMVVLEGEINKMALGSDTEGLKRALSEYQGLILSMVKEFKAHKGETGNLLEQRVFNFQMERPKSPGTG
jgi:hypothetical protein